MKRIALVITLIICLLMTRLYIRDHRQRQESALITILQAAYTDLASLPDFEYVTLQPDGSFLLHRYHDPVQSTVLPADITDMLQSRQLLGLRKRGDDLFFVTSGAADDELGYVISGDTQVDMDSLWHLDRVNRKVYKFSTWK